MNLKLISVVSVFVLMMGFSVFAEETAPAKAPELTKMKGEVVKITEKELSIKDAAGKEHLLIIDKDSVITHQNKPVKIADVKPGQPVELEAAKHENKLHVRKMILTPLQSNEPEKK